MTDRIETADGVMLEAEWRRADPARAGMVLCHPHPRYGGTMRSIVVSALFDALPTHGVTCMRFNFRGVEGSSSGPDDDDGEHLDAEAVVAALDQDLDPSIPLVLAGWSFGADVALSTLSARIAGWLAIAPPLRFGEPSRAGSDPRPKHLVLAEHDEFRHPADVEAAVAGWAATSIDVVAGASHYFVGRTDRVAAAALAVVDRLTD